MAELFYREISVYKKLVEQRLKHFFDAEQRKAGKISPFLKKVINRLAEFTLRSSSKRIRASLVKIGYEAYGQKAPKSIVDISAAIEIMHACLLIHDDIIDRDDWRRQGITFHKYFEKYHRQRFNCGEANHFGISTAILAGVVGQYLVHDLIWQSHFSETKKVKVQIYLNQILKETNYGQLMDIYNEVRDLVSKDDILLVHKLKTARYSFEAPLIVGAILAGAKKNQVKQLSQFAIPAGLAFQIRDDILGIFGTRKQLGKPVDSDIQEGKQTLLFYNALKAITNKDKTWLQKHYGRCGITYDEIKRIKQLFDKSGSRDKSQRMIVKYLTLAKKAIARSGQEGLKNANILLALADYLISRDY